VKCRYLREAIIPGDTRPLSAMANQFVKAIVVLAAIATASTLARVHVLSAGVSAAAGTPHEMVILKLQFSRSSTTVLEVLADPETDSGPCQ
jgi:hypothetical protein